MVLFRVICYVVAAMFMALLGSYKTARMHRWMYYSMSFILVVQSVGATLNSSGVSWTPMFLDIFATPALVVCIILMGVNLFAIRKK